MKCLACGAEMRLSDVRTDTTRPFAIERRIFQCSSCRQTAQRLGFDRSGLPDCTSPAMKTYAPAIRLQSDRLCGRGRTGACRREVDQPRSSCNAAKASRLGFGGWQGQHRRSKHKRGKQGLLPGRGRWKSSAVGRWHSRSARQQGTHPTRSARAITAIIIRGL